MRRDSTPSREIYKKQLWLHGATQRQRVISLAKDDIAKNVIASPSYKTVVVNGEGEQALKIVATQTDNKKRFTTMPNENVALGDVIEWNGMHWLITKLDFDDEIIMRGEIEQCNRIIKWQNPFTLQIISRWCLCTKPYTSNVAEGAVVSTSNREYKIQLPYDTETALVDMDKRFMLEVINGKPRTYKVTSVDSLTNRYEDMENNSGFLVWNLTQDAAGQPDDSVKFGVCNYIDPDTPPAEPPAVDQLVCKIIGRKDLKIGGSPRKYTAEFYKEDGLTIDSLISPIWNVICEEDLKPYFTIQQAGGTLSISAFNTQKLIDKSIEVCVSDESGKYQGKFIVDCEVV